MRPSSEVFNYINKPIELVYVPASNYTNRIRSVAMAYMICNYVYDDVTLQICNTNQINKRAQKVLKKQKSIFFVTHK